MKVAINSNSGGFSLSHVAFRRLRELGCETALKEPDYGEFYGDGCSLRKKSSLDRNGAFCRNIPRNDPHLLQVVEEMGEEADGRAASLKIIDIPDDIEWEIEEHNGREWVVEKHRRWS